MSASTGDPRVSVVIPTFNRARDLRRCLRSLETQTLRDFEVLVCDDGSTDDTEQVVRDCESTLDLTYLPDVNWGGAAHPRNRGIARARAPFVAFLDSDDWWTPHKLAASVVVLERGADVVYHDMFLVTRAAQTRFWRRVRSHELRPPVYASLLMNGNVLPLSSVVMRRSVLNAIGGMPEDRALVAMEDYACWLEAARVTDRFVRLSATYGYYWAGGGNISADERTLGLLDVFEERFVDAANPAGPPWIAYARGRALQRLGDYVGARDQLGRIGFRPHALALFGRAAAARIAVELQRRIKRDR